MSRQPVSLNMGNLLRIIIPARKKRLLRIIKFVLTNLNAGVTYHFRVGGKDISGNGPNWSQDVTFSTTDTDVSVGFPDTTVDAGTTFWIPLQTSNVAEYSVTRYAALIGYDSNRLQLIGIKQENTLISTWNPLQVDSTAGFVSISANGSYAIQGAGHLILLGFKIKDNVQTNQIAEIALLNFRFDEGWPAVTTYNSSVNIIGQADFYHRKFYGDRLWMKSATVPHEYSGVPMNCPSQKLNTAQQQIMTAANLPIIWIRFIKLS